MEIVRAGIEDIAMIVSESNKDVAEQFGVNAKTTPSIHRFIQRSG